MNEVKQQQLLAGQTSVARKVFGVVPMQEAWTIAAIHGVLKRSGASSAAIRDVAESLGSLRDSGLVREMGSGNFQRVAITTKPIKPKSEQVMPLEAKQTVLSIKKAESGALDALAMLSSEVVGLADEFGLRMKKLAERIEEVALTVEAERESNAETIGKAKRLQELMKEFAQ